VRPVDLDKLEFPRLLEAVAAYAASDAGREACLALAPHDSPSVVRDELARVEHMGAITEEEAAPLGSFPDIRPHLAVSATPGARLSGRELTEVAATLATIRGMRGFIRARAAGYPLLLRYLGSLHALPELDRLLASALDEEGQLRDGASPTLRALRRELRELRGEIERRLTRLLHQGQAASAIAEDYVTVRNGRFVVPVRAQAAAELPGIVQDRSASGETLFVEPLFAVEPNNRLLIAAREEAQEEARILAEITAAVGSQREALAEAFAALTELDTLAARVAFGRRHRAVCPAVGRDSIRLGRARHPLLELTGRPVTPVDIVLDDETFLLVISGPNTGGKSVALKTLGLAVLMAQAGIPVLADRDTHLPVFAAVWTDIGDPQNVAGDLSTFSGHVRNVAEILRGASERSLVLLDEPGTGTDPEDGAALARVLLEELVQRRSRVLATTHFQSVKAFALARPGAQVAGVDFDPDTFAPRYRLIYRSVAPSLGLQMARRLGLPPHLVDAAERERGRLGADLAAAAAALESERRRYELEAAAAATERERLGAAHAEQGALLEELRDKRRRRWADELGEARRFADELRREGERMLDEARERPHELGRRLRDLGNVQRARIGEQERAVADGSASAGAPEGTPPRVGDEVQVTGSGLRGRLEAISGERARVTRGTVRFDVPVAQLRRVGGAPVAGTAVRRTPARIVRDSLEDASRETEPEPGAQPIAMREINLVGERVQSALHRLESFLDQSVLEDQGSVRIIHGMGTGALREAIRQYLAGSPYVSRFEQADRRSGGGGATIAYLR
jgi:DNA mismatch repair protein MutS2